MLLRGSLLRFRHDISRNGTSWIERKTLLGRVGKLRHLFAIALHFFATRFSDVHIARTLSPVIALGVGRKEGGGVLYGGVVGIYKCMAGGWVCTFLA